MALDNYSNLKETIVRLDGSSSVTDIVDDAIILCESEMYANAATTLNLRSLENVTEYTSSTSTPYLALPTDYINLRRVRLKLPGKDQDILYATPESMQSYSAAGRPKFFTVTDQIEFDRIADSSYVVGLSYLAKVAALDDTNTANAVLTKFPTIYLYGAMWAVNLFNGEEQKASYYYQLFINSIKGANKLDKKGRYGPGAAMRTEGATP